MISQLYFQYPCPLCKIPIYCSSNCKQQHLPIHRDICQFKKQKRHDHHEIHETSSGRRSLVATAQPVNKQA